jgi:hypothetical protein
MQSVVLQYETLSRKTHLQASLFAAAIAAPEVGLGNAAHTKIIRSGPAHSGGEKHERLEAQTR